MTSENVQMYVNKFEGAIGFVAKNELVNSWSTNNDPHFDSIDLLHIALLCLQKHSHDDIYKIFCRNRNEYYSISVYFYIHNTCYIQTLTETTEICREFII